jgi:hypothetical protein
MELAAELEATLREFAAAAPVEVRENGGRVAPLEALSWEVRGAAEKPLLHLWSADYNLTRRVLAITDRSEQRLILAVERFGRSKPDRLEFVHVNFERPARELTRHAFGERLRRILAEQFPDDIVDSLTISPDLELRSLETTCGAFFAGAQQSGPCWASPTASPRTPSRIV